MVPDYEHMAFGVKALGSQCAPDMVRRGEIS